MGKSKVLVKVHPEGKYVVDLDKDIDIAKVGERRTLGQFECLRHGQARLVLVAY